MLKTFLIILVGILVGLFVGYVISSQIAPKEITPLQNFLIPHQKQVIGFLPFWLINKAQADYSQYLTTLTYFGLTVDSDGHILKRTNPQETEPGYLALNSGKVDPFLDEAKKHHMTKSLLVFMGNKDSIDELVSNPEVNARNLIEDVGPIMKDKGFSDLNIDIESTKEASDEARFGFTRFAKTVKGEIDQKRLGTLTVEVGGNDLIHKNLIDVREVGKIADFVVLMAYDYHYIGSSVTGYIAPLFGAGVQFEYDVQTAVERLGAQVEAQKIILGTPVYGYEWETLDSSPSAAIIPGTGVIASSQRVDELIKNCASCSAQVSDVAKEPYLIYKDQDTQTFQQIFYPDQASLAKKVEFAKDNKLGGLAIWALGYEDSLIMGGLKGY